AGPRRERRSFLVRELCLFRRRCAVNQPNPTIKKNRRGVTRRAPKRSTRVTCRRGSLGMGPNIGLSLLDVSETGARLLVKESLAPGEKIELGLLAPARMREHVLPGVVAWGVETAD